MSSLFFRLRFPGLLALTAFISACAPAEITPQDSGGGDRLALNARGRVNNGSPLKITVLQLTDPSRFLSAGYEDLQRDAHKTLRGQVRAGEEIFLLPDDKCRVLPLPTADDVHYLGIFAEYQDLAHKRWRLLLPLPPRPAASVWTMLRPPPPVLRRITVTPDGLQGNDNEK
ncbi:type VI secretion system lipoprotein TssJ [Sodalis sp. C49]|uniref:type VI secretion system lipoprotein TssJ n=1 Tax=unclassified Sodalis (in: enterobacteria) TaxID=2636512 RepID=UPI003965D394